MDMSVTGSLSNKTDIKKTSLLEVPEHKARRSSLEICGLVNPGEFKELQTLDTSFKMDNKRLNPRRRMSMPVLPSQHQVKQLQFKQHPDAESDDDDTKTARKPPVNFTSRNNRTDLKSLKKDLKYLRPQSTKHLKLNGRRQPHNARFEEEEPETPRTLEEQFEALRLCRYLRQPGNELEELTTKDIFKDE